MPLDLVRAMVGTSSAFWASPVAILTLAVMPTSKAPVNGALSAPCREMGTS